MGAELSKEEEQRRLEAIDAICELVLYEARARNRPDMVSALKEVTNDLCARVGELMATIRQSVREAVEKQQKEDQP